jgi:hypothetical protein
MLRNLLGEIRHRHLWPIPLVAIAVAVAAPLLFLKSAPTGGPLAPGSATATPTPAQLTARAEQLVATTDAVKRAARKASRTTDPFQIPSPRRSKSGRKKASSSKDKTSSAAEPVPVVITNADGTAPEDAPDSGTTSAPIGDVAKAPAPAGTTLVDVRFGERMPATLHRAIPRLQTFVAGGHVIAIFVKYSPSRDKAVFAIAPATSLSGGIDCRRKQDLCRYVDIPAGKGVRLTTLTGSGSLVTHRLDVERIVHSAGPDSGAAAPAHASCLLGKLLTLSADDPWLASDACTS